MWRQSQWKLVEKHGSLVCMGREANLGIGWPQEPCTLDYCGYSGRSADRDSALPCVLSRAAMPPWDAEPVGVTGSVGMATLSCYPGVV